jgi:SulP family sulfate permease
LTFRSYATGLIREAIPDFSWHHKVDARREFFAGLIGAFLVIPQAITFAYLAGVPPEYGLYCAIFVGFFASLFGNSPMVGGPNTAMSILLGLAIIPFAGRGSPLFTEYMLLLCLMVGLFQLFMWLLRGAELFRYFSPAAISGIKMGVGVLLIASALDGTLGLSPLTNQFFYEKFYVVASSFNEIVNPYSAAISGVTIGSGLLMKKRWPRVYIVAAVILGGTTGAIVEAVWGPITSQVELLGRIPLQLLPLNLPLITPDHLLVMEEMLPVALAIAVLGLAQSLVIARDLKTHGTRKLNLQKEIFAQAVSNILGPFFSSFAGAGSFNRTSIAVEMGAKTPLSGMVSAFAVVIIAWGLGPFLTKLPIPAVAAVLVLVGIGMIQGKEARLFLRNRIDGAVFLVTTFSVMFLGLEAGIFVAAVSSVGFFVANVSKVDLVISHEGEGERVSVRGNLFYASLDSLTNHLRAHPAQRTTLDLSRVSYCDAAAAAMIESIKLERLQHGGCLEVISVE